MNIIKKKANDEEKLKKLRNYLNISWLVLMIKETKLIKDRVFEGNKLKDVDLVLH